MIIFSSDLDNTLIYSYKHDIGFNKRCVEWFENREISFMDRESIEVLRRIQEKVVFVPNTTRSVEQYKRINLGVNDSEYALVCNGGVLLYKGCFDRDWYMESLSLIEDGKEEIEKSMGLLKKDGNVCFEIRCIEGLFVFTKSEQPVWTVDFLRSKLDESKVDVFNNGSKVYVLPKELSKGKAILRLKKKLSADKIIAAGDSLFDISMLMAADVGLCPRGLVDEKCLNVIQFNKEAFTTEMLLKVWELIV